MHLMLIACLAYLLDLTAAYSSYQYGLGQYGSENLDNFNYKLSSPNYYSNSYTSNSNKDYRSSWSEIFNRNFITNTEAPKPKSINSYAQNGVRSFSQNPYSSFSKSKAKKKQFTFSPPVKRCGIVKPILRNYVANGYSGPHEEWPWYAQIIIRSDSEAYCGSTLISDQFLLTAAHCFDEIDKDDYAKSTTVLLKGVKIRMKNSRAYEEVKVQAVSVIIHPGYIKAMTASEAEQLGVEPGPKHDLALVQINIQSKDVLDRIMPICLPSLRYQLNVGTRCKIMGHGFTSASDEDTFQMPTFLQIADVKISASEMCKAEVDSEAIKSKINEDTLCIRGPIHPCVGDSGGPLICKGESSYKIHGESSSYADDYDYLTLSVNKETAPTKWYLTGVTSFAVSTDLNDKCGLFKSAVFGKVANYIEWIQSITQIY